MVEFTNWGADGTKSQPLGASPVGQFIYTPGGYLSVQVMSDPPAPPLADRDDDAGRAQATRQYIEYFGTYHADRETRTLTHRVEGSTLTNRVGENYLRNYRIEGDVLTIEFESEDGRRFLRRLERVEAIDAGHATDPAELQPD